MVTIAAQRFRPSLRYVAGSVSSKQVVKLDSAKTVNGQSVAIRTEGGTVMIDGAKVVQADIAASNGVIHVIDTVILPNNGQPATQRHSPPAHFVLCSCVAVWLCRCVTTPTRQLNPVTGGDPAPSRKEKSTCVLSTSSPPSCSWSEG